MAGKVSQGLKEGLKNEIIGIAMIAVSILLLVSFWLVPVGYYSPYSSRAGAVGGFLVRVLAGIAGNGRFLFPLIMGVAGFVMMRGKSKSILKQKFLGMLILFLTALAWLHFPVSAPNVKTYLALGVQGSGGGLAGAVICWLLKTGFGRIGAMVILSAFTIVSVLLITDISLAGVLKKIWAKILTFYQSVKQFLLNFLYEEVDEDSLKSAKNKSVSNLPYEKEEQDVPVIISHDEMFHDENVVKKQEEEVNPLPRPLEIVSRQEKDDSCDKDKDKVKDKDAGEYTLPNTDILQESVKVKNPRISKDITDRIRLLEETLDSFGVKVKVTQVSCGPAVTRYEMQPCPGVKVSKILSLSDDIALNLAARDVRIEAPVPGKSVIGIEVPRDEVSTVCFREVLESSQFLQSKSKLTIALGKDITGNSVVADLASMPHLLIAGATGSGKSVCMNTLICSILFKARPGDVKFLMIDPKMVELTNYNGLPHLLSPVITDLKKAAGALKWVVREMENRYNVFASTGVKDLYSFNELKQGSGEEIPQIVVVIDELADLMMVAARDVEDSICRLAQMARAAGIHLLVATQRPSVDVITGLIKANIPSRIAFAVSSQIDSRTILDMAGAEKLLGKGDMLFYPVGAAKPIRVQGVFLSEQEIGALVQYLKAQGKPQYVDGVTTSGSQKGEKPLEDELFSDAAKMVIEAGQASVSLLQRRFRIGYSRAARLMDMLESRGIVGGYEGSKPRSVLISMEQFENLANQ
ncbi:MAG: DNA translocase FtsK [Desulfitobacteriaceae bacterium]|nr:DNA translocase FtsK [Desulfitobacteriaceae bacterium]MDD4751795.1 DNA translocase FtsK [Desulfitobacteriaceae bacterium]